MQRKLTSDVLTYTRAPCFINGEVEYVAVGGDRGQGVEIWDIETNAAARVLEIDTGYITSTFSTNNILAIGSNNGALQLWDVRNWSMFQSFKYSMKPRAITLTDEARYLSIGGTNQMAQLEPPNPPCRFNFAECFVFVQRVWTKSPRLSACDFYKVTSASWIGWPQFVNTILYHIVVVAASKM